MMCPQTIHDSPICPTEPPVRVRKGGHFTPFPPYLSHPHHHLELSRTGTTHAIAVLRNHRGMDEHVLTASVNFARSPSETAYPGGPGPGTQRRREPRKHAAKACFRDPGLTCSTVACHDCHIGTGDKGPRRTGREAPAREGRPGIPLTGSNVGESLGRTALSLVRNQTGMRSKCAPRAYAPHVR
jgi:hypothetical protein